MVDISKKHDIIGLYVRLLATGKTRTCAMLPLVGGVVKPKEILILFAILVIVVTVCAEVIINSPTAIANSRIMLITVGAYMLISQVLYTLKCCMSKRWPKSTYTIRDEKLKERKVGDKTYYQVLANLEYMVRGKTYMKDICDDGNNSLFRYYDDAVIYINRLKTGGNNLIYYNPDNPGNSILKPGIKAGSILHMFIGLVIIYIAVGSLYAASQ